MKKEKNASKPSSKLLPKLSIPGSEALKLICVHIDHIDNPDGDIWAVQIPSDMVYVTVHDVKIMIPMDTFFRDIQPRAFLYGYGYLEILESNGKTYATIHDTV